MKKRKMMVLNSSRDWKSKGNKKRSKESFKSSKKGKRRMGMKRKRLML